MSELPVLPTLGLQQALKIWSAAVAGVEGENATRRVLDKSGINSWQYVAAVGKAASAMTLGARKYLATDARVLVVTKYQHIDPRLNLDQRIRVIESGHPVPDHNSLRAGQAILEFVENIPPDGELLMLVSGGASALVVLPVAGMDLAQLQSLNKTLLGEGYSIDQINFIRIGTSRIKGGKLLGRFRGRRVQVYGLSDIPGDDSDLIGSGIAAINPPVVTSFKIPDGIQRILQQATPAGATLPAAAWSDREGESGQGKINYQAELVGSNRIAREAAVATANALDLAIVECEECLQGDILIAAMQLADRLRKGKPGVYIWGGETTVKLPQNPGRGGRNQSLALALALQIEGLSGINGVVAGTDGTDGPTAAAGGLIYSGMPLQGADNALARADAGSWLQQAGLLLTTGPTGTNVMDLAVIVKTQQ